MITWHPGPLRYRGPVVQWWRKRKCRLQGHRPYLYNVTLGGVTNRNGYCLRCGEPGRF